MAKKLTDKQKRFVDEYLVDFNATQSAIRAGYSVKTAQKIGSENLTKPVIQAEIQKRQQDIKNTLEITQEKLLSELAKIAFAETTDFTIEGFPIINGAVHRTNSKLKAIEMLGKRLGLWDNQDDSEKLDKIADTLVSIKKAALNDRDKQ